jgi:hypothetical protein
MLTGLDLINTINFELLTGLSFVMYVCYKLVYFRSPINESSPRPEEVGYLVTKASLYIYILVTSQWSSILDQTHAYAHTHTYTQHSRTHTHIAHTHTLTQHTERALNTCITCSTRYAGRHLRTAWIKYGLPLVHAEDLLPTPPM